MKIKLLLGAILMTVGLYGCAAKTGHQFLEEMPHSEISANLIANKTTSDQVRAKFGDPEEIDLLDNGREQWVYSFKRSEAKGANFVPLVNNFYRGTNDTIKKLKILMNAQGKVEKYAFSASQGETKLGAFQ